MNAGTSLLSKLVVVCVNVDFCSALVPSRLQMFLVIFGHLSGLQILPLIKSSGETTLRFMSEALQVGMALEAAFVRHRLRTGVLPPLIILCSC